MSSLSNGPCSLRTIRYRLIAALGRVGVETASVVAVIGAAPDCLALQGSLSNFAAGVLIVDSVRLNRVTMLKVGGLWFPEAIQIFPICISVSKTKISRSTKPFPIQLVLTGE